jgi:formiminotetrahydrofolate cyclodeaminase
VQLVHLQPVEDTGGDRLHEVARLELRLLEPVAAHELRPLEDRVVELAPTHDVGARGRYERAGGKPLAAENGVARARDRDDDLGGAGISMTLPRLGARQFAERREPFRRAAVRDDTLDARDGRADARDLRLGLMPAADDPQRPGAPLAELTSCDGARRAGPKPAELIRLENGDELRRLGVEQADDEGHPVRSRNVELPAGEPEARIGSSHVGERSLAKRQPSPRCDLDLTGRHPPKGRLDRVHGGRRLDERLDVALGQVQGHGPQSRKDAEPTVDSCCLTTDDYRGLSLGALLDRISGDGLAPGGGSASALTVAFAARLVAMVARCSPEWEDAGGVLAQANAIGERAVDLAHTDGRAWEEALVALLDAGVTAGDDPRRSFALEQKLEAAASAPLEIASLGADVAALAAAVGERCDATYRADAAAAAALAAGGASAAAHLVRVNLGVRESDPRLARALESEQTARELADSLLETT